MIIVCIFLSIFEWFIVGLLPASCTASNYFNVLEHRQWGPAKQPAIATFRTSLARPHDNDGSCNFKFPATLKIQRAILLPRDLLLQLLPRDLLQLLLRACTFLTPLKLQSHIAEIFSTHKITSVFEQQFSLLSNKAERGTSYLCNSQPNSGCPTTIPLALSKNPTTTSRAGTTSNRPRMILSSTLERHARPCPQLSTAN
jgi:hypothetical protein